MSSRQPNRWPGLLKLAVRLGTQKVEVLDLEWGFVTVSISFSSSSNFSLQLSLRFVEHTLSKEQILS